MSIRSIELRFHLGCLLAIALPPLTAQTWNGTGADDNFSTATNWSTGVAPANDGSATATLNGSTRTTPVLDQDYSLDSLVINASGFTLDGANTLTLGSSLQKTGTSFLDFTANVPIALFGNIAIGGTGTNGTIKLNGIVSGSHGLAFSGGNLLLAGENSFTGDLTVSSGRVEVGGNTTTAAGSILANVVHAGSGSLAFKRKGNLTYSGVISGTTSGHGLSVEGGLAVDDKLTLTLTNQNTYSGITNVGSGVLVVGTTNALPTTTQLSVSSFGTLDVDHNQTVGNMFGGTGGLIDIATGVIFTSNLNADSSIGGTSGEGSVAVTGAFDLQTYDEWEHTGGTTITDTNLIIGAGHGYGGLTGNVVNNGQLTFNQSTTQTFAGDISGTGIFTKQNSNTLTLSGALSHSGGIEVVAGTIKLSSASAFTLAGDVSGAGNLEIDHDTHPTFTGNVSTDIALTGSGAHVTFDHDDNRTYSAVISSQGQFTKEGTGTLTFDTAHTHTGLINLNEGSLIASAANALGSTWIKVADSTNLQMDADQNLRRIESTGSGVVTINNASVIVSSQASIASELNGSGSLLLDSATGVLTGGGSFDGQITAQSSYLHLGGTFNDVDLLIGNGSSLSASSLGLSNTAGSANVQSINLLTGSRIQFDILNATGAAGTNWDHITASGEIAFGGTLANPIQVIINGTNSVGGYTFLADFDQDQDYQWNVLTGTSGIIGFDADLFTFNTTNFYNKYSPNFSGEFSLSKNGNNVYLNYTTSAVPEPGACALLAGFFVLGLTATRRKRLPAHSG